VQVWNGSLQDFCNCDGLVDGTTHSFKNNLSAIFLFKDGSGIANINSNSSSGRYSNFILINGFVFVLGLLDSSVLIRHFFFLFMASAF